MQCRKHPNLTFMGTAAAHIKKSLRHCVTFPYFELPSAQSYPRTTVHRKGMSVNGVKFTIRL